VLDECCSGRGTLKGFAPPGVARNVATLVAAPKLKRTEVVPFDEYEARKVLAVPPAAGTPPGWSVALGMGIRQGEALGAW
jgi:hypothetical protein